MATKFIIINSMYLGDAERGRFDFLSQHGIEYEYVDEYVDDTTVFLERQLKMETEGPDAFHYSADYIQKLQGAGVIITYYSPVPSVAFEGGKTQAVIVMRSGVENVDLKKATAAGVKVVNAPGRLAVPVAEFTVGLIIAEMKNIARGHEKLMHGQWITEYANSKHVFNIKGKNVGLVGCGPIGARVAAVMQAMEANVLVYDPYVPEEKLVAQGYVPQSLEELCRQADIISVHFRLTEETVDLINEEHFALMKPTAIFINTARAGLVNEQALLDALQSRRILGAGLDVFHEEPVPPNSPLLQLDNVTLTPHLAGTSTDLMELTFDVVMACLKHYFKTGNWTNVVNREESVKVVLP